MRLSLSHHPPLSLSLGVIHGEGEGTQVGDSQVVLQTSIRTLREGDIEELRARRRKGRPTCMVHASK
jgi:hypothetical protein